VLSQTSTTKVAIFKIVNGNKVRDVTQYDNLDKVNFDNLIEQSNWFQIYRDNDGAKICYDLKIVNNNDYQLKTQKTDDYNQSYRSRQQLIDDLRSISASNNVNIIIRR
jgi:hypothetical protein